MPFRDVQQSGDIVSSECPAFRFRCVLLSAHVRIEAEQHELREYTLGP